MKKTDRFICVHTQNNAKVVEIWVDTQTGVNYLYIREGFSGGLTPLLDAEGKPVISKDCIEKN